MVLQPLLAVKHVELWCAGGLVGARHVLCLIKQVGEGVACSRGGHQAGQPAQQQQQQQREGRDTTVTCMCPSSLFLQTAAARYLSASQLPVSQVALACRGAGRQHAAAGC